MNWVRWCRRGRWVAWGAVVARARARVRAHRTRSPRPSRASPATPVRTCPAAPPRTAAPSAPHWCRRLRPTPLACSICPSKSWKRSLAIWDTKVSPNWEWLFFLLNTFCKHWRKIYESKNVLYISCNNQLNFYFCTGKKILNIHLVVLISKCMLINAFTNQRV